ncbi:Transcriptional regulator, partial [Dysosmobacter welbionis]
VRLLRGHRHRGLPPLFGRRGGRGVRRSRVAGRGGAREPPALLHRLLLRPAGPVLRHLPLCPGMAGGGG